MKKVLKRSLCLLAVLVLVFSMTACGKPSVEEYVDKNGDELADFLEKQLSSMGMEWECDVVARSNKMVVVMKSSAFDDISDDVKKTIQSAYDEQKGELRKMVAATEDEVKDLKGVIYEVCDSDGNLVANIDIDF